VIKEVFGRAGGLGVIDQGLGLETVGRGELVGGPEGELSLAGAGLSGEEEGSLQHIGDFERIEEARAGYIIGRVIIDGQVAEGDHRNVVYQIYRFLQTTKNKQLPA
jgi:hypothetical protein